MSVENKLFRVDQNMTTGDDYWKSFEGQKTLCRDISIYIYQNFQEDLFGFRKISVNDFARKMGYKSANNLQKKVREPYQFRRLSDKEIKKLRDNNESFETVFEDALYRMHMEPFVLTRFEDTPQGRKKITKAILLIDELKYIIGPRRAKIYEYKPHPYFIHNLSRYFEYIDYNYNRLPAQVRGLYLHLSHLKNQAKQKNESVIQKKQQFDLIASLCNSDAGTGKHTKLQITRAFNKLIKKAPELNCELQWSQSNYSNFNYQPIFVFHNLDNYTLKNEKERKTLFLKTYTHYVFQVMSNEVNEDPLVFEEWLNDSEIGHDVKAKSYKWAQKVIYGNNSVQQFEIERFINSEKIQLNKLFS